MTVYASDYWRGHRSSASDIAAPQSGFEAIGLYFRWQFLLSSASVRTMHSAFGCRFECGSKPQTSCLYTFCSLAARMTFPFDLYSAVSVPARSSELGARCERGTSRADPLCGEGEIRITPLTNQSVSRRVVIALSVGLGRIRARTRNASQRYIHLAVFARG